MSNNHDLFYTSIARYYSDIFPFNPMQLSFIKSEFTELMGKKILDIGCATGELARKLATEGAQVTAMDLNEDLLRQARDADSEQRVRFQKGNMLDVRKDFRGQFFDGILCFGNTLVHLNDMEEIKQMLLGVRKVLAPKGQILLQILNYDYIMAERIPELPNIENERILFERKYLYGENPSFVEFRSALFIKSSGEVLHNSTKLLALKSQELVELLREAGFGAIRLYANFKMDQFGGKHLPLVASAIAV